MRISHDMKDSGFHPNVGDFCVTINNNPVLGVITADEELGLVRFHHLEANGGVVERVLIGVVRIERVN